MKKEKLKPIYFHSSYEEMRLFGQMYSLELDAIGSLAEMHRLNCKVFGMDYGTKVSKTIEIYSARPGEDIQQFYKRINQNE